MQVSWRSKSGIAINCRLILFVDSIEFALDLLYAQGSVPLFATGIPQLRSMFLQDGLTLWFTGLSGAGKTTLNRAVYERLVQRGFRVESLDGDDIRRTLGKGLGFSKEDRDENIR